MINFSNIYVFTNLSNGMKYVGQSINPKERYKQHLKDSKKDNLLFHNAIKKYGIEGFKFEVIEENILLSDIDNREKFWIKEFNSKKPNGYNLTDGGEATFGYHHNAESKLKMSNARKGKFTHYQTEETRKKISEGNKGRIQTDKAKLSFLAKMTGRKLSDEHKRKISDALKGRVFSEEHNKKISITRENMSQEQKNKMYRQSVETKKKNGFIYGQHFMNLSDIKKNEMYKKISNNNKRRLSVKSISTQGEEHTFSSIGNAYKWISELLQVKSPKSNIRRSLASNGTAYGFKWKYINDTQKV